MTDGHQQKPRTANHWDVYWTGTHENAAHREGGPQDVVLEQFWSDLFQRRLAGSRSQRVLDLACGNGAVIGFALQTTPQIDAWCLDYSLSAMLELRKRYPKTRCIAADALNTPFADSSFDLICSQFGIEYAGAGTIEEAARLVAPNGLLAAILHLRDGAIDYECRNNLKAIEAIWQCKLFPLARDAFNARFALNAGTGSVKAFKAAEKRFAPAISALEAILKDLGRDVAAGLAEQVYRDIAHMYRRTSTFDRKEVIAWIDGMVKELNAYRGRMSSMINAAMDADAMQRMEDRVVARGLAIRERRVLEMGIKPEPAAWVLVCERA